MGCQKKNVEKIVNKDADYVIGLKGNQSQLHEDVCLDFASKSKDMKFVSDTENGKGHGRIEARPCTVSDDIQWLGDRHSEWKNLKSIIEIASNRSIEGREESEQRYYISSLPADVEKIQHAVRHHWGIENKLHWVLEMTFKDEQSRIRKGNAPSNVVIVKKIALTARQIIRKSRPQISLKRMRKLAGWD